jgi:hypothetical protein
MVQKSGTDLVRPRFEPDHTAGRGPADPRACPYEVCHARRLPVPVHVQTVCCHDQVGFGRGQAVDNARETLRTPLQFAGRFRVQLVRLKVAA